MSTGGHFLLTTETVKTYLTEGIRLFSPGEPLTAEEIGDGNINYVFRVRSAASGRSLIVKQADTLLRSSGRPLDISRSKREAEALRIYAALTPQFIPQIYRYDAVMSTICMEDISYCRNLRKELMAGRIPAGLAEYAASFLAEAVFPTSGLILSPEEKKERVKAFINPELCAITETLVFSEPYCNGKNRNRITAGNEAFVQKKLYDDEVLKTEIGALRETFMNKAEALIHGDLHTGSVFTGSQDAAGTPILKIIDPEFAFYGPIGYDLGNLIANLYFAWMHAVFTVSAASADKGTVQDSIENGAAAIQTGDDKTASFCTEIAAAIEHLPLLFKEKMLQKCRSSQLSDPVYNEGFLQRQAADILADGFGFAGTEMIRRTVGDTKTPEFDAMGTAPRRIAAERALIKTARLLIKRRRTNGIGVIAADYFRQAITAACRRIVQ